MRIAITGASGFIGTALAASLADHGHQVVTIGQPSRHHQPDIPWNPAAGELTGPALEGLDAVIHLAGESLSSGRWTRRKKRRILDSRVQGTRLLAETLARLERPPQLLISASAVGYYGDRADESLDEQSARGTGFLADVCQAWEAAADPARQAGIRTLHIRTGVVLGRGGALPLMALPFRLFIGGRIGDGRQMMPWIALTDVVDALLHLLADSELDGPLNLVAPQPVTNREWTRTLGRVLKRPTLFPLPAIAAKLLLGEMAGELLLASVRVTPDKLIAGGYHFTYPDLEPALRSILT